jgi:hypothetical protein
MSEEYAMTFPAYQENIGDTVTEVGYVIGKNGPPNGLPI